MKSFEVSKHEMGAHGSGRSLDLGQVFIYLHILRSPLRKRRHFALPLSLHRLPHSVISTSF